jgi:DNA-binding winged helix-turn-helix (wHTH) protein/transposase
MKSSAEIARIIALQQAGWSKRRIATELAISRNTVSRIINQHGTDIPWAEQPPNKLQATFEWLKTLNGKSPIQTSRDLCLQIASERGLRVSQSTMDRARVLLQGSQQTQPPISHNSTDTYQYSPIGWQIGPYHLNANGALTLGGIRVAMPSLQERLLVLLARHANQVLSREKIAAELDAQMDKQRRSQNNVTLMVHRLRQELAQGPLGQEAIRTIHGQGYILVVPVQPLGPTLPAIHGLPPRRSDATASNPFHLEAHDLWPQRDPYKLSRQEHLLKKSIDHDPLFGQGYLELCYLQLLQCFWGMRSALDVRSAVQNQLSTLEQFPSKPDGWLGIKAEIQSLLLWQPRTTQRLYGAWLADTLPGGMPRYSWARHLIFSGRPHTALRLLTQVVRDDLCQGWMNLAMAYCALGDLTAAEEAVNHQLRVDTAMVGTRLFLAMLKACQGKTEQATRLIGDSGLLERPFQGVQALTAYALARGDLRGRSQQLLDQALALSKGTIAEVGAIGYWGLAALALGRQEQALQLLKLSVKHRCYSAPVLYRTPFLKPHGDTLAVRLFLAAMRRGFAERP